LLGALAIACLVVQPAMASLADPPSVVEGAPDPVRQADFAVDAGGAPRQANFLRKLSDCPDACAGMRCPDGWVTHIQCTKCACVRPAGYRTPPRVRSTPPPSYSGPTQPGGVGGCTGSNQMCMIDAECCSGRCLTDYVCEPDYETPSEDETPSDAGRPAAAEALLAASETPAAAEHADAGEPVEGAAAGEEKDTEKEKDAEKEKDTEKEKAEAAQEASQEAAEAEPSIR